MYYNGKTFSPHVKLLAKKLNTSESQIRIYASEYHETDEKITDDHVPLNMENFIRLRHLQETHPSVHELLCKLRPLDNSYDRWICEAGHELRKLKKGGE